MHTLRNKQTGLRMLLFRALVLLKACVLCAVMTPTVALSCELGMGLKVSETSSEAPLELVELSREITPGQLSRCVALRRSPRPGHIEIVIEVPSGASLGRRTSTPHDLGLHAAAGLCGRLRC